MRHECIHFKFYNNDLLFLETKIAPIFIEQTNLKSQQILEIKKTKPTDTFSIDTPLILEEEGNGMSGLTSLDVGNFVFNATNQKDKF